MQTHSHRIKEIPVGWNCKPLAGLVASLTSGGRPSGGGTSDGKGVFSLGGEHITNWGTLDCSSAVHVPSAHFEKIRHFAEVQPGDILINKDGANTGKLAIAREHEFPAPTCINEHVFRLRTNQNELVQAYAFYFLFSPFGRSQIHPLVQGSAQPGLNQRFTKRIKIAFPADDKEQIAIARILDAVDNALERTRTAVEEAKRLKLALLQRFFYSALGETAYADRPKKKLPTGWAIVPTESLLSEEPKNGVSPESSSQPPGTRTFSIAAVRDGRVNLDNSEHIKYARLPEKVAEKFRVRRGDVLIVRGNANSNLVGKAGMIDQFPAGCIYPDITKRVIFRTEGELAVTPAFAVLAWNHPIVHNQVLRRAKTSNGTLKINNRDVKQINMPVPTPDEQAEIVSLAAAVDAKVDALNRLIRAQREMKMSLMHDLLSGRVRVPIK